MISVIELEAVSQNEGVVPFTGPYLRRSILRSISSRNPLLAKAVESSSKKVFVEALLRQRRSIPCGFAEEPIHPGSDLFGAVIVLDDKTLTDAIRSWAYEKPTVVIGDVRFKIVGHTYQEIDVEDYVQEEPCRSFRLRFLTPTCFRRASNPYCYLYPNPRLIVSSLAPLWNSLAKTKIKDIRLLTTWTSLSVVETGYDLCTTKPIDLGDGRTFVGFTGWVNYKVASHPEWDSQSHEDLATWLNTLLRFAELVGVGFMRHSGFGRVRHEIKRR